MIRASLLSEKTLSYNGHSSAVAQVYGEIMLFYDMHIYIRFIVFFSILGSAMIFNFSNIGLLMAF